ncbi:uncharacterized protein LOC130893259 [Diorhabda carinulata]|uniref:uncharacterized protein LOC130893259 n=1 Tax=Diorhabda carinulata TaxID=1163345 RepID=UPI0025A130F7|nr:uncharacterized protein LOC130893259 [Diorhabda carinulata]
MFSETVSSNEFEYIVEVKKEERICFGSTINRSTGPIGKGLSPYQKRMVNEINTKTGPGYYKTEAFRSALHPLLTKICSKKGTVPLCSKVPRFKEKVCFQIPSPGRYNTCHFVAKFKQNAVPFCTNSKIGEKWLNCNPGKLEIVPLCTNIKNPMLQFIFYP